MKFRKFEDEDADFCFKTRSEAFIKKFYDEIGPEAVNAGINAFMPSDYIRMSKEMIILIMEYEFKKIGFISIKRLSKTTAEIPLIYIKLNEICKGFGTKAISYIEDWVRTEWNDVNKIIIDTIIPKYNGNFYKKLGYNEIGKSLCKFPDMTVEATRYEKKLFNQ